MDKLWQQMRPSSNPDAATLTRDMTTLNKLYNYPYPHFVHQENFIFIQQAYIKFLLYTSTLSGAEDSLMNKTLPISSSNSEPTKLTKRRGLCEHIYETT